MPALRNWKRDAYQDTDRLRVRIRRIMMKFLQPREADIAFGLVPFPADAGNAFFAPVQSF